MPSETTIPSGLSRRKLLQLAALAGAGTPLLAACSGASTSGGGADSITFLSTQFAPVEERQRFEQVLAEHVDIDVAYNPVEAGTFATTVSTQVDSGQVNFALAGGLHGDLSLQAEKLADVSDLVSSLADRGFASDVLTLAELGTGGARYIPWMQATYVVAVHNSALEWLPSGADVENLTYEQYLEWAQAGAEGAGRPIMGFPAGSGGLYHRFFQGYLLPSFTGGQITTFRSEEAVTAWEYMRDLWSAMAPGSTNWDFMQEPLAAGEVLVAWDHVARLVGAVPDGSDEWIMVPAPSGPHGKGYMLVVAGLALPDGGPERESAEAVITALTEPETQLATLRANAFFPVVDVEIPDDLPTAVALEARAVAAQQAASDAILSLPPVGLGDRDGEVSQVFKDTFAAICLDGADIAATLDSQADTLNSILEPLAVPCWAPDPTDIGACSVQ